MALLFADVLLGLVVEHHDLFALAPMAGNNAAVVALIGLLITAVLMAYKVKGAIFIGIIATTIVGIPFGVTTFPESIVFHGFGGLAPTFGAVFTDGFNGLMQIGLLPLLTAIITFAICDCFDTVGTLIGTASNAGMLDKDGKLPKGDKALIADAIATMAGTVLGTSTVTTFVESSTGISEGGRTGLTSVVVAILFALAAFFFTIAIMPFAYSISDGIAFGFIFYSLIKLIRGKGKEVPVFMYIISVLFIVMYVLSALPA